MYISIVSDKREGRFFFFFFCPHLVILTSTQSVKYLLLDDDS